MEQSGEWKQNSFRKKSDVPEVLRIDGGRYQEALLGFPIKRFGVSNY